MHLHQSLPNLPVNHTILIAQTQIAKDGLMFMQGKERQNRAFFAAPILRRMTMATVLFRPSFPQRNPLVLHVIEASKE
jgi:hypothetical protein